MPAASSGRAPSPPSASLAHAHEIDYRIFGHEMQTVFGDGSAQSQAGGIFDKFMGAGKRLITGESLRVDTGCLVALTRSVTYDIEYVGNVKSAVFGGEGVLLCAACGSRPCVAAVPPVFKACRQAAQGSASE